jgi:polyvinyl alcohol dehydrogenase (cytochrome)
MRGEIRRLCAWPCAAVLLIAVAHVAPRGEQAPSAVETEPAATATCNASTPGLGAVDEAPRWNGWGGSVEQHRFQPSEAAGVSPAQLPALRVSWAFGFEGVTRAYAQPSVAGRWVFVGSPAGAVHALDAATGCTHWTFVAEAPVRTAISVASTRRGSMVYFGDERGTAYGVDAESGALRWKTRLDEHPAAMITGAPLVFAGTVYVPMSSSEQASAAAPAYACCTFRGSMTAVDAATGRVRWKTYTVDGPPQRIGADARGVPTWGPSGVAVSSSPTLDRSLRRLYIATGDSYSAASTGTANAIVALDLGTGRVLWRRKTTAGDANLPASPILVERDGRRLLLAIENSGTTSALDPDRNGQIVWRRRLGQGGAPAGLQWGAAVDRDRAYVAAATGLYALTLDTGEVAWHTPHPGCRGAAGCSPAQSAAVTAIDGAVFSGGLDGHLRAYAASDGRLLWDVDTKRAYATVNGVAATGGAIDGAGAVVVDGMLFVNSGYGDRGHAPGNVLLAFSLNPAPAPRRTHDSTAEARR